MYYEIDGKKVYASNGGVKHKPGQSNIIFIHGAGMDHTIWVLFNRFFARAGFNTLAPDLPGHGKSEGAALSSVKQCSDWLSKFIESAQIEQPALVGHSLGSLIALDAASKLAGKVSKLILMGSSCPMPVGEPLLSAAKANKHAAIDMIMLYGHSYRSQLGGNPVAGINIVNSGMRLLERAGENILYTDLNACNEYANGLHAAAKIQIPSTLILGEEDKMTPPAATRALIGELPDSRVEILKACGHMMLAEQPEQVHQVLVSALNEV